MRVVGGFHRLAIFFCSFLSARSQATDVVDVNCQNRPIIGYTRSWFFRNEVLKTRLTGSPYPSLPSSTVVFAQLFLLSWSLKQATLSLIRPVNNSRSPGNVRLKIAHCLTESFPLFGIMTGQIKYRRPPLIISPTYKLPPPPPQL